MPYQRTGQNELITDCWNNSCRLSLEEPNPASFETSIAVTKWNRKKSRRACSLTISLRYHVGVYHFARGRISRDAEDSQVSNSIENTSHFHDSFSLP